MQGSVLDEVRSLIVRLAPAMICDDCIRDRLNLADGKDPHRCAVELAGSPKFVIEMGECAICGITKKVITYKSGSG